MDQKDKKPPHKFLRAGARWQDLRLYHKSDATYQLTVLFCQRFLPKMGDRTVDQMVQAARSGKQNIIEGSEDGKTSTEMEIKLINVARGSIGELRQDYIDYINTHHLQQWNHEHPRYKQMQEYTKTHNEANDYLTYAEKWTAEEFCNTCISLCFQLDAMFNKYINHLQELFVTEGGIKERMHAARTGYREGIDKELTDLRLENKNLKEANAKLSDDIEIWKRKYNDLRDRAVNAYRKLEKELKEEKEKNKRN